MRPTLSQTNTPSQVEWARQSQGLNRVLKGALVLCLSLKLKAEPPASLWSHQLEPTGPFPGMDSGEGGARLQSGNKAGAWAGAESGGSPEPGVSRGNIEDPRALVSLPEVRDQAPLVACINMSAMLQSRDSEHRVTH